MMLSKAGWALGLVLLVAHFAVAQPEVLPEPKRLPPVQPSTSEPGTTPLTQPAEDRGLFPADETRRPPELHVGADYLLWWLHRGPTPPLLTTAPNNGRNANGLTGGIIGEPGTTPLFTSDNLDYGSTSGMRLMAGISLDSDRFWSFEGVGFFLPRRAVNFRAAGNADGTPLLTIPFLDAASGQQSALDISSQDTFGNPYLSGSITIHSDIQVWGYELNFLAHAVRSGNRSVDLFAGFRTLALDENLTINQSITAQQTGAISLQFPGVGQGQQVGGQGYYAIPAGQTVTVLDAFSTRNRFYGAQAGGRFVWDFNRFTVDLTGKIAVGATREEVSINGVSSATAGILGNNPPVTNLVTPGGVFALQNNSGTFFQNKFTVVPEIGLNLGYAMTSWLNLRMGYSALYSSSVARPGGQIDPVLNSKLVPTGAFFPSVFTGAGKINPLPTGAFAPGLEQGRPYFAFRDTAFWAHGIHFGMEFRY
jgi:hypothetical protein